MSAAIKWELRKSMSHVYNKAFFLICISIICYRCHDSNQIIDGGTLGNDTRIERDLLYDVPSSEDGLKDIAVDFNVPDIPIGPVVSIWMQSCGNDNTRVGPSDISVDNTGNIYISGDYMGTLQCGKVSLKSKGFLDGFLLKLNPIGEPQWGLSLGSLGADKISAVSNDNNGNVYVGANYEGNVTFGGVPISAGVSVSRQGFVAKIDANGKVVWITNTSLNGSSEIGALRADYVGNLNVAGQFLGKLGVKTVVLTSQTKKLFAGRITQAGTWKDAIEATVSKESLINNLAIDKAGNTYIAGNFSGTAKFGNHTLSSNSGWDGFLAKISSKQTHDWAIGFYGPGMFDRVDSVEVNANGESIIGGRFSGATINIGSVVLSSKGGSDGLIAKIDSKGKVLWALAAGGSGNEWFNAVNGSNGSIWATGNLESSGYMGGKYMVGYGATIAKIDKDGALKWAGTANGPGYSVLERSFYHSNGYIISVGTLKGGEMTLF